MLKTAVRVFAVLFAVGVFAKFHRRPQYKRPSDANRGRQWLGGGSVR